MSLPAALQRVPLPIIGAPLYGTAYLEEPFVRTSNYVLDLGQQLPIAHLVGIERVLRVVPTVGFQRGAAQQAARLVAAAWIGGEIGVLARVGVMIVEFDAVFAEVPFGVTPSSCSQAVAKESSVVLRRCFFLSVLRFLLLITAATAAAGLALGRSITPPRCGRRC